MPNINITVADKIATNMSPGVAIVCGNNDYTVTFTFDAEWAAHPIKTARFVFTRDGKVQYTEVAFSGTVAAVPVLSGVLEVFVGVYAGDLRTTTPARVLCDRSILCGGGTHEAPPEDVYNQILAACNEIAGASVEHLANKNNPHGVTAAQVGAAPSGYGLGETSKNSADINTEKVNGYFRTTSATENKPFQAGAGHVRSYSAEIAVQNLFRCSDGTEIVRYTTDGGATWKEDWANPPMALGTEYRTTERWDGSPLYTKLIDFGALPNAESKSIATGVQESNIKRAEVIATNNSNTFQLPYFLANGTLVAKHVFNSTNVQITTTTDYSGYNVYIRIWYIKN